MKLEVGMYVRYKNGIGKINYYINNNYTQKFTYINNCGCAEFLEENQVTKASHNIIDLIEAGDYVNGGRVVEHAYQPGRLFVECVYVGGKGQTTIENYSWELTSKYVEDEPDVIKSIVTKEQFESMSYKIGD